MNESAATQELGFAGQVFLLLAFGLVIAFVVKLLVPRVARFSPSFESVYTAVIVGYLVAFGLAQAISWISLPDALGRVLLIGTGFVIQVMAYARIITGPNGEKLNIRQAVIVSVLQALIGFVVVAGVTLITGGGTP